MLPIFVGNIFQQLYNMVDTVIVGRTVNSNALAGVGVTGAVSFLVLGLVWGLTAGFAVMTSQCFGAKDAEAVKRSVGTSLLLSGGFAVILTAVAVPLTRPLLRLMQTPDEIIGYAHDYVVVIFWGIAATFFYNIVACQMRAVGDSLSPLIFLIIASVLNVGLDFAFIVGCKMGVAGAGWATVLAQVLSAIAAFIFMIIKYPVLRVKARHFRTDWHWCWRHLIIGLPMGFQYSITGVGVIVQQAVLNTLGTPAVTATTAANKLDALATQSLIAIGSTMATYCGQNYGAGEYKRIRQGVNAGLIVSLLFGAVGSLFVIVCAKPLTLFLVPDADAEILRLSQVFLNWQGAFYSALAVLFVYRNALQGMSRSGLTVIAGVVELGMRVLAAFVLVRFLGFTGASMSNPIAWVGAVVYLIIVYYTVSARVARQDPTVPPADMESIG